MKRELNEDNEIVIQSPTSPTAPKVDCRRRLGMCEVCATIDAKYTCPKCQVKTCGVACVNIHKKELNCNGIRDRTKFIPLRNMTSMDFMNDYYFLEECVRYTQDRKSDPLKRFTHYKKELPAPLFRLRKAAAERGTTLHFLLHNFTRHKENTSIYDGQQRKILWRVEWTFVNANCAKYSDERCDESRTLFELLDKYTNAKNNEVVVKKEILQYYQTGATLKILLKAEGIKGSPNRCYVLDGNKSLKQNLAKKTVVEFPQIFVSYDLDPPAGFDLIDSDEDVEAETKSYQNYLNEMKKKQLEAMHSKGARVLTADGEECHAENTCDKTKLSSEQLLENTNNFLFTDESLLEVLSSDDNEDDAHDDVKTP